MATTKPMNTGTVKRASLKWPNQKINATGRWHFFGPEFLYFGYLYFPGGAHQTEGLAFYKVKGVVC
jgi:hypothetical protein